MQISIQLKTSMVEKNELRLGLESVKTVPPGPMQLGPSGQAGTNGFAAPLKRGGATGRIFAEVAKEHLPREQVPDHVFLQASIKQTVFIRVLGNEIEKPELHKVVHKPDKI